MEKLYYVYIGKKLPQYGSSAIRLAARYSGMELNFIGNEALRKSLQRLPVNFIAIEDFYDSSEFDDLDGRFERSAEFRNGFWLKTLERFYVIEQYMKHFENSSFFHAELDQLLFRTDQLALKIKELNKNGLFIPFHSQNEACASVIYCNDRLTIRDFIRFTNDSQSISSEMLLLASWAEKTTHNVYVLPTISSETKFDLFTNRMPGELLQKGATDGVVDALELGQWIGGQDPRNEISANKPKTKFVEHGNPFVLDASQLKSAKFSYDASSGNLQIATSEFSNSNVYNLHFHAKLHNWLMAGREPVDKLLILANAENPIMLTDARFRQMKYRSMYFFSETYLALRKNPKKILHAPVKLIKNLKYFVKIVLISLNIRLGRRPSSEPFLSGDTFRTLANHIYESETSTFSFEDLESGDIVFCQASMILDFNEEVLSKLEKDIVLILGNSDQNFDLELASKLNLERVTKIFAQNLSEKIEKFETLPIGLENAWRLDHGKPFTFKIQRLFRFSKRFKIMWTFSPTNINERTQAAMALSRLELADEFSRISKSKHRFALSKYAFVASPPGNGLDCHRTWEAMYLRCIPIVKRSFMTDEYEKNGLPIWVVDSYDELSQYDEETLKSKYLELAPRFNSDLLWFNYWRELIKN
jgi:hypothetical protein